MGCSMRIFSVSTAVLVSACLVAEGLSLREAQGSIVSHREIADELFEGNVSLQEFLSGSRSSKALIDHTNDVSLEIDQPDIHLPLVAEDERSTETHPLSQKEASDFSTEQNDWLGANSFLSKGWLHISSDLSEYDDLVYDDQDYTNDDVTLSARAPLSLAKPKKPYRSSLPSALSVDDSEPPITKVDRSQILKHSAGIQGKRLASFDGIKSAVPLSYSEKQDYSHVYQKRGDFPRKVSAQGSSSPPESQAENEPPHSSGQRSSMGSISAPVSRAGSPHSSRMTDGSHSVHQQPIPESPRLIRMQSVPADNHMLHNVRVPAPAQHQRTPALQFLVDWAESHGNRGYPLPNLPGAGRSEAARQAIRLGARPPHPLGPMINPFAQFAPPQANFNGGAIGGGGLRMRLPNVPENIVVPGAQQQHLQPQQAVNQRFSPPSTPRQRSPPPGPSRPRHQKRSITLQSSQMPHQTSEGPIHKLQFSKRDSPRASSGPQPRSSSALTPMTNALQRPRPRPKRPLPPFSPMTNALRQRAALTDQPRTPFAANRPTAEVPRAEPRNPSQSRPPSRLTTGARERTHIAGSSRVLVPFAAVVRHQNEAGPSRPVNRAPVNVTPPRHPSRFLRQPVSISDLGKAAPAAR